jgi:hypothetical protein
MTPRREAPRLADMIEAIEAIERVRHVMGNLDLQCFEADLGKVMAGATGH